MNVASTSRDFNQHLKYSHLSVLTCTKGWCCSQLHQLRVHGHAVVAIHGRNGRSGGMRLEVHSALPMLLHLSGANYCARGGNGLVRTQDGHGAPTFRVVRADRQCGEARRVSRRPKRVEIAPNADERGLHITRFRSTPTNIRTSVPHMHGG